MPILLNGGLELSGPEPSFSFGAARYTTSTGPVYDGQWSAELPKEVGQLTAGRVQWTLDDMTAGATYDVACYVRRPAGSEGIRCRYDPGDGTTNILATKTSGSGTWTLWEVGSFAAVGTTGWLRFDSLITDDGKSRFLDEVTVAAVESEVAIKLSELGVDSMVATLQSYLSTELTAIDTERADGITMASPANGQYYKRPKSEVAGYTAHCEVFESGWDFEHPDTDIDWERVSYKLPLTVRITFYNRDQDTAATMVTRARRYCTGIVNTILQHPHLGQSSDTIKHAFHVRSLPSVDDPVDDGVNVVIKGRSTVEVIVDCIEGY